VAASHPFDGLQRLSHLEAMAAEPLDLLVIGGGITGAGVLWDAQLRGLRAGLVEMQDFAAGTSSRSTKLIHGGLRYLEQYDLALVREVGRERAVLHRLAPHLVQPLPMLLPFAPGGRHGPLTIRLGTWLYDRLADVRGPERRRVIAADEVRRIEPALRHDVAGGVLYFEYLTDDARLTMEVIQTAVAHGALAANYARAIDLLRDGQGRVRGALVEDAIDGRQYEIAARAVVNAAGPWADSVAARAGDAGLRLRRTKGVHVVFARERLPLHTAVYFQLGDGRMLFAIPRGAVTYVGTTDTDYDGDLASPMADEGDIAYLLDGARAMFPSARLAREDVVSCWAGLRVLVPQPGRSASDTSRREEVRPSADGLITIVGGKLTGFRSMAQRVVDRVCAPPAALGSVRCGPSRTAVTPLQGTPPGGPPAMAAYLSAWESEAGRHGLDPPTLRSLAERYGANAAAVLRHRRPGEPIEAALVRYAAREEMAVRATDVVARRTDWLLFRPERLPELGALAIAVLADVYGWPSHRKAEEERLLAELRRQTAPPA
jgi:glycerol-3-phosphate dehydrogenase